MTQYIHSIFRFFYSLVTIFLDIFLKKGTLKKI